MCGWLWHLTFKQKKAHDEGPIWVTMLSSLSQTDPPHLPSHSLWLLSFTFEGRAARGTQHREGTALLVDGKCGSSILESLDKTRHSELSSILPGQCAVVHIKLGATRWHLSVFPIQFWGSNKTGDFSRVMGNLLPTILLGGTAWSGDSRMHRNSGQMFCLASLPPPYGNSKSSDVQN